MMDRYQARRMICGTARALNDRSDKRARPNRGKGCVRNRRTGPRQGDERKHYIQRCSRQTRHAGHWAARPFGRDGKEKR